MNFLLAVHISDGILTPDWLAGGFALAALLALLGAWRIRDEEIPQVALLTAAFFVVSLIHLPLKVTSVHLLLNGMLGVILGRRAALAIPVGLFLQAALLQHGGMTTLGINSVVMVLPALLAWQVFAGLQRLTWLKHQWFRTALVGVSALVWTLSLAYGTILFLNDDLTTLGVLYHILILTSALLLAVLASWLERRMKAGPEFPLGLLVGEIAVLATILMQSLVLLWGGQADWRSLVAVSFVAHLPIAAAEGIALGFTVSFLARVKPEMLISLETPECSVDPLP